VAVIGEPDSLNAALQTIETSGRAWINVERPTESEIEYLVRQYRLVRSDLESALDRAGPTGVWDRDDHAVVTLQVPVVVSGKESGTRTSTPITLFIGPGFVVTVHTGEIRQLNRLFRQLETDEVSRLDAFAPGVAGVVFAVVQRLVDATVATRATLERAISAQEDVTSRASPSRATTREALVVAARLRADARSINRVAAPLPAVVRGVAGLNVMAGSSKKGWDRLIGRAERLASSAEQDLAAIEGIILDATAIAQFESARALRVLAIVATLTLPVVTVVALMALPTNNPLSALPNSFAVAVAIAGAVFLVALFGLRRRGMV
jgi:magnesium transporter